MSDDIWSMMGVSSLYNAVGNTLASTATSMARNEDSSTLGKDAFMRLLLIQMQNQDPLSPINNNEFFAQLAQFSLLEQMWQMNDNLAEMQRQQQLLQAGSLIGRTVEFETGDGGILSGQVDGIQVIMGDVYADVDGTLVPLDYIISIRV